MASGQLMMKMSWDISIQSNPQSLWHSYLQGNMRSRLDLLLRASLFHMILTGNWKETVLPNSCRTTEVNVGQVNLQSSLSWLRLLTWHLCYATCVKLCELWSCCLKPKSITIMIWNHFFYEYFRYVHLCSVFFRKLSKMLMRIRILQP